MLKERKGFFYWQWLCWNLHCSGQVLLGDFLPSWRGVGHLFTQSVKVSMDFSINVFIVIKLLLHVSRWPSWSCCCFPNSDQDPGCLLIPQEWRSDRRDEASSYLSAWRCRSGMLLDRAGAPAAVSTAIHSGVWGLCLALPVFQLPIRKEP